MTRRWPKPNLKVDHRLPPRTPDGERYLLLAKGMGQPRPFHFRWLWPMLCQRDGARWRVGARMSLYACALLAWPFTHSWAAVFIPFGLAGLTVNVRAPVLVDLPAMALALGSAVCAQQGWWGPAMMLAVVAGATKETAPVFAAAWAWSWWPLVGLAIVGLRALQPAGPEWLKGPAADALTHPVHTAWERRKGQPFAWFVLPWGACIIGLAGLNLHLAVVLALAYGQLLVTTDLVRLYQWAWPSLAAATFAAVPHEWWPVLVVVHLASPHRGEGF